MIGKDQIMIQDRDQIVDPFFGQNQDMIEIGLSTLFLGSDRKKDWEI